MLETSARLLQVLSHLQSRRDWTSAELAERLGVTTRTVRKDIDRLRRLGYPIDARPGAAGGYRLGVGAALPPLLLDDDEAVAIAIGLRTAATGSASGLEESSVRALLKVQQMLPSRLRHRISAYDAATLPMAAGGAELDPQALTAFASACRDRERVRVDERDADGGVRRRTLEPYRLAHDQGVWHLFGWDLETGTWDALRVDRLTLRPPPGPRFVPRDVPSDEEIRDLSRRRRGEEHWRFRARVVIHASAAYVRERMPITVDIEDLGPDRCAFEPGSDHVEMLALYLGLLGADFEAIDSPELVAACRDLAQRYDRAVRRSDGR